MARRLRPGPASRRPARVPDRAQGRRSGKGKGKPRSAERGAARPRAGMQLVVWTLVLTVFGGLAMLSGQADGLMSGQETPQASAPAVSSVPSAPSTSSVPAPPETTAASVAQAQAGAGGRLLAAPEEDNGSRADQCSQYDEEREYLPLHRWTSFELFVVDNATIFKTQLFVSMISSLMFMAAALAWRIIGTLMGFGYTFDMICQADDEINSVALTMSKYASWFLIPAWLFVLMAVIRRWSGGGRRGPASGLRLIVVFLVATGTIFFIHDQAAKYDGPDADPMQPYTMPWMAKEVQGWFGAAADSLYSLQRIGRHGDNSEFTDGTSEKNPVFYDNSEEGGAGSVTCAKLDETLYDNYIAANENTSLDDGKQALVQVSKIWQMSLVRSWQSAQFGEGTEKYPSPAHASCRYLEANAGVSTKSKLLAFDKAAGFDVSDDPVTTDNMARGYFIDPAADEQSIMVAWGACKWNGGDSEGTTIPQWAEADVEDGNDACKKLYSNESWDGDNSSGYDLIVLCFLCDNGAVGAFYFNGDDELKEKLGDCYTTQEACRYDWNFVAAWLGKNQAERLTQGLMSMIVGFVFLFVMGPMAVGMTVASVGLAALVMIMPLTLLLIAAGLPQGMRVLKLTGAAAAGDFLFTMGLTFLTMLTDTTYRAISETIGSTTPNFFEQVAQAAAPLVALYMFRKISRILGLGDISSTTGATGFATAIVLKTSGDRRLSRNPGQLVGQKLGNLGVGKARLGALDEKSLQRRLVNNRATRAMGRAAGRGAKRAVRPVTDWTKDKYEAGRARLMQTGMNLRRKAASGSPGQRAAAYGGAFAAMAGLTMLAPPAVLATLPLMAFAGTAATARGAQAGYNALRAAGADGEGGTSALAKGAATGLPMAGSARSSMRQADDWHRNIIRVGDADERQALIQGHTQNGLDTLRARQWGGMSANGLNPDFKGFVNDEEKMRALSEMADVTGLKPDQLMMGNHGLAIPVPVHIDKRTGQRAFEPGTSIEQASHPVHYLDRYTLQRKMVDGELENDDQYIARLTAQLRERGYVNDGGEFVDVFAAHGFDTRQPEVRERVARFVSGGKDEELSRIVITSRRSEDAAVAASREWAKVDGPPMEVRQARDLEAVSGVMTAARQEIGDFSQIKVVMPDGGAGTAGELQRHLEQQLTRMASVLAETQQLHDDRAAGFGGDFEAELQRLTQAQQECAAAVDRASAELRDAVDASAAARGLCDLRVQMADPRRAVDADEVARIADDLARQTQQAQQEWHREIDRLAGALSRSPSTAADADQILDALDEFESLLNKRIASEKRENQGIIDALDDLQRSVENGRRMTQSDPRTTSSRPLNMREELMKMYDRERSGANAGS